MSEPRWTAPQLAAIEDRGGALLVSAAAGSGKTAVLVERAVRMICDEASPVPADRLLIVTFTRAAAEELRGRIAGRLAQEACAHPGSAWLRRQRLLLGRADICTIDAFCMQLLKTYFAPLGLPPDFGLADDALAYALRVQALAETMEQAYEDPDFRAFASLYGRSRSDAAAAGALEALYDFSRTLPGPQRVMERLCTDYETSAPLGETPWGRFLLDRAQTAADSAAALVRSALQMVAEEDALAPYAPALEEDLAFFTSLSAAAGNGQWDEAAHIASCYAPCALRAVRGYTGGVMDAVKALRAEAKAVLAELQKNVFVCTQAEFEADRARTLPMLRALARAAQRFSEHFFARKLEEKALEYSDFEHLSLQLLCGEDGHKTALAAAVSARYDAVMVDEYQDTNALQALLYRCLARDDGSNLFFVGDVKQSIYRFRLASPEIFIEMRAAFAPYEQGGAHPAAITLGHNFRSAKSVIDQINDVFACMMSRAVGDVDYGEGERLYPGADSGYDGGPMELLIADASTDPDAGDAHAVADAVRRLVDGGFLVRGKNGGTRPCGYGDICVLLRSRARFAVYESVLGSSGVPASADAGDSMLTAPETAPLLSLLRAVDNPGQDIHLAAALLSPMFGFTPDDLARLRARFPKLNLYAALLHSDGARERDFCEFLSELRRLAAGAGVEELCAAALARTHYFAAVGAMDNGAERRENVRAFTAWAASAGAGGLAAFLRTVDNALESGAVLSAPPPVLPHGAVSIMTVHRSKGLEFPVVILADCARHFNLRDAASSVLFHPRLGAGLALRGGEGGGLYATAPHRAVRLAQRAESVSEEMRILYVALTRARDKLIVTFPLQNPAKTLSGIATTLAGTNGATPYLLSRASSFADWLCAFGLLHPDGAALRKAAGGTVLPLLRAQGRLRAEILPPREGAEADALAQAFVRESRADGALLAQLRGNFTAQYPGAALSRLPVKVSVSALAHREAAPVLARPAFLYTEGLTAAERGTALHSVLQFADLAAAAQNAQAELARLVRMGYVDAQTAAQLDGERFASFLSSPLAARMRAAQRLLREYAFLTAVPARLVQPDVPEAFANRPVLVQGIADAVLLCGQSAEIADYKTDRGKTPAQFVQTYARQLLLYRAAVEKRLGVSVTRCTLYSFELGREIDVPLAPRA